MQYGYFSIVLILWLLFDSMASIQGGSEGKSFGLVNFRVHAIGIEVGYDLPTLDFACVSIYMMLS